MSEQLIQTPAIFGDSGNFLLERELGSGGMGGVYMGRDKMLDRPVAVKVMLREYGSDPAFVEKFKKEAQAAARLLHPNIAQVYSYGISDGMPYIAMELVAGGSLYQLMKNSPGTLDVTRVLKIGQQVAAALRCSSDMGVVHGDIKPENILLDANGNAKIVDFGLAAMQADTSEIWGTPYYIAPEKLKKEVLDFRADMYSLGGTLYHALTGVAPFEGADANAVVRARFEGLPPPPSEVREGLSPQVDDLVMRMLAFDREERFPSFEALLVEFRRVMAVGLSSTGQLSQTGNQGAAARVPMPGGRRAPAVRGRKGGKATMRRPSSLPSRMRPQGAEEDYDDEEEGGNLGTKVFMFIGGAVLLIIAVVGLLFWYNHAQDAAKKEKEQAQISSGIGAARAGIADKREKISHFMEIQDGYAASAIAICETNTAKMAALIPPFAEMIRPPEPQELLDAYRLTNIVEQIAKATDTNAAEKASAPASAAPVAKVPPPKPKNAFREPTEDEKDSNSPEGIKYAQEKAEWEAKQAEMAKNPPPAEEKKETSAEELIKASETSVDGTKEPPTQVKQMQELWVKAYGALAASIRLRHQIDGLLKKLDEADGINGSDQDAMKRIADINNDVATAFSTIQSSPDTLSIGKALSTISSRKNQKLVSNLENDLRVAKAKADRTAAAAAAAAAAVEAQKRKEAEHKLLVEQETAEAAATFEGCAADRLFRQLSWRNAIGKIQIKKNEFKTVEGQLAADLQIRKVNAMKGVHDLFIKKMANFTFKRSKQLKGYKIIGANVDQIEVLPPNGKPSDKKTIYWRKLFEKYHGNLNELIIEFVEKAYRQNALSLKDWSEAMFGSALILQLACDDDPTAVKRGEQLIRNAVKTAPSSEALAKQFFPKMDFTAAEEDGGEAEEKTEE